MEENIRYLCACVCGEGSSFQIGLPLHLLRLNKKKKTRCHNLSIRVLRILGSRCAASLGLMLEPTATGICSTGLWVGNPCFGVKLSEEEQHLTPAKRLKHFHPSCGSLGTGTREPRVGRTPWEVQFNEHEEEKHQVLFALRVIFFPLYQKHDSWWDEGGKLSLLRSHCPQWPQ